MKETNKALNLSLGGWYRHIHTLSNTQITLHSHFRRAVIRFLKTVALRQHPEEVLVVDGRIGKSSWRWDNKQTCYGLREKVYNGIQLSTTSRGALVAQLLGPLPRMGREGQFQFDFQPRQFIFFESCVVLPCLCTRGDTYLLHLYGLIIGVVYVVKVICL